MDYPGWGRKPGAKSIHRPSADRIRPLPPRPIRDQTITLRNPPEDGWELNPYIKKYHDQLPPR